MVIKIANDEDEKYEEEAIQDTSPHGSINAWFGVGGDLDDFIFYSQQEMSDHDPHSCK